jgi:uncharacterized HAD superfamily protein
MKKRIIVSDIDGTICSSEYPENYHKAKPIWSVIKRLNDYYAEGHIIYYLTARHMIREAVTKEWFKKHGVKYNHIFFGKPVGDLYIDDRGASIQDFLEKNLEECLVDYEIPGGI